MKFWKKKPPSLNFEVNFPRPRQRSVRLNEVVTWILGAIWGITGTFFTVGGYAVTVGVLLKVALIGAALLCSYSSTKKGGGKSNYLKNIEQNGHLINTKQASDPIKVIYGVYRVGGNRTFPGGGV